MVHASASFPATNDAPRLSRRFVRDTLTQWCATDLVSAAQLAVSEIVTNAVLHAVSPIEIQLSWIDTTLRIEILDGTSAVPAINDAATDQHGDALRIIEELVGAWGTTEHNDGKAIWLTIDRYSPD